MAERETDDFVLFYSHDSPFSNFFPAPYELDGVRFHCSEQGMMYAKAVLFEDRDIAKRILAARTPMEAKKLGRKVHGFNQKRWDENKLRLVQRHLQAKFTSTPELRAKLVASGKRHFVECSPRDCIWGIGLGILNPQATNPEAWRGQNLLGQSLDRVRDSIVASNIDPVKAG